MPPLNVEQLDLRVDRQAKDLSQKRLRMRQVLLLWLLAAQPPKWAHARSLVRDMTSHNLEIGAMAPQAAVDKQAELDRRLRELVDSLATATESVREVLARVHASVVQATAELNQIELFPSPRDLGHTDCFDCGRQNLQVFHTSKRHGYHLCPDCFRGRERRGLARSPDTLQQAAPELEGPGTPSADHPLSHS